MALSADSYSSVNEVTALTRHLLDGNVLFGVDTRPTLTEVENFINYASSLLNAALAKRGFTTPVTQATVVYALDMWVSGYAASWVELTQRGAGYSDAGNERASMIAAMVGDASEFVEKYWKGWAELGAAYDSTLAGAASFTALDKHSERSDPTNTTREQPLFSRRKFDRSGPV